MSKAATFEGRLCRRGHTLRYFIGGACVACRREYQIRYRAKDPERRREANRASYHRRKANDPDTLKRKCVSTLRWQKQNPASACALVNRRRVRKLGNGVATSPEDKAAMARIHGEARALSWLAGSPRLYAVDHIIPIALGGPDLPHNVQVLTRAENLRKGSKPFDPADYEMFGTFPEWDDDGPRILTFRDRWTPLGAEQLQPQRSQPQ